MSQVNEYITSKDGTRIAYTRTGRGDGLIIVHGGGRMANDYERLAQELADRYTVYTYDRRGRGESGDITADHCMEKECEDLAALMNATGAEYLFGHSMGGIIALETATRRHVAQLAVYEAPISVNDSVPTDFLPDFKKAISRERYEKAMAVMMKGLRMHEAAKMPLWLLTLIIKGLKIAKRQKDWTARNAKTLPTLITDFEAIRPLNNTYNKYKKIRAATLLMGGSESAAYLTKPVELLAGIIPYSSKQILAGMRHIAPEENPGVIAHTLKQFFK